MREIKASLGIFHTLEDFREFLIEDNERPYRDKKYRRKLGLNKIRNAYVEEFKCIVWVYSRGYGLEFVFSEEEKNQLCQ